METGGRCEPHCRRARETVYGTQGVAAAANVPPGLWTWVAGSNTFDATGVYGTVGVAARCQHTRGTRFSVNLERRQR